MNRARYTPIFALIFVFCATVALAKGNVERDSVVVEPTEGVAMTILESDSPLLVEKRRAKRGLSDLTTQFVPARQWIVGATASYTTHSHDDFGFLVIEGVNSVGYGVSFSPMFSYAIANNMALGARCDFSRDLFALDNAELNYGDDETGLHLVVDDYYIITQRFSSMAIWRQYLPLGKSRRFALFNEVRAEVGYSVSKFAMDSPVTGTFATTMDYGLAINPGIVAFATNSVAVEVSVGVFGVSYSKTEQVHNQVSTGTSQSAMIDCQINLFAIGLGVSYYF